MDSDFRWIMLLIPYNILFVAKRLLLIFNHSISCFSFYDFRDINIIMCSAKLQIFAQIYQATA